MNFHLWYLSSIFIISINDAHRNMALAMAIHTLLCPFALTLSVGTQDHNLALAFSVPNSQTDSSPNLFENSHRMNNQTIDSSEALNLLVDSWSVEDSLRFYPCCRNSFWNSGYMAYMMKRDFLSQIHHRVYLCGDLIFRNAQMIYDDFDMAYGLLGSD